MNVLFRSLRSPIFPSRIAAAAVAMAVAIPSGAGSDGGRVDDTARFLAGMPMSGKHFGALAATSAWQTHCQQVDREFGAYRERTLNPLREWAERKISTESDADGVVRYLFSGPDILHALAAFPAGGTFLLGGLEPVGTIPDLDRLAPGALPDGLGGLRTALGEIIQFSFFRTEDMKEELRQATFPGTIPILALFLARSGQTVESVEVLSLENNGSLALAGEGGSAGDAVRIRFHSHGTQRQSRTLYYFCSNVADGEVKRSGLLTFLESQPRGGSYLKAASYLMHKAYFSQIRDHILDYSQVVLQDDSGIPLRHFDSRLWDIAHYGHYEKPIDLFAEHYQPDLRQAYLQSTAEKLEFGKGYLWRKNRSNLLRAIRKPLIARPVTSTAGSE